MGLEYKILIKILKYTKE